MSYDVNFLHLTDTHLSLVGEPFLRNDYKVTIPGIKDETRELALDLLCRRLAEKLQRENKKLDAIFFTGDAQNRGKPGGHKLLLDMLLVHFGPIGISPERIVAVPGNHDVPRDSQPGSLERYRAFTETWRDGGCVTPWLDGVDDAHQARYPHSLVGLENRWAVFPINTANWSHINSSLPEPLASIWPTLPALIAKGDSQKEATLREQLNSLTRYDMARVSEAQLEFLRKTIDSTPQPTNGRQVRIVLLHHHLRSPNLREELKPFSDFSNIELIRAFLRDRNIDLVIHGHKHDHSAQFEHIYNYAGDTAHRTLVISGATFEAGNESDAVRLLGISGIPNNPSVSIEGIPVPRGGVEPKNGPKIVQRIWTNEVAKDCPVVIYGSNLDEVYDRVCEAAANEAANGTLIAHLDLRASVSKDLPLPANYPLAETMDDEEKQKWLKELVEWWQLDQSKIQDRMPFVHGSRLRKFGGKIDQIQRVISILKSKASTRALAVLVDPFRDFSVDGLNEEFASFCLVQFKRSRSSSGRDELAVIAYYRAQEFARWWPINIAELCYLQMEICVAAGLSRGVITTITPDARTHSRSPTQVAMPVIDRWLDQAPERILLLSNALMERKVISPAQTDAVRGWERTLLDLEATATEYNPDGLPVPIEGLRLLASYLEALNFAKDPEAGRFIRELKNLARSNEGFEAGMRSITDFNLWAPSVIHSVQELRDFTATRFSSKSD
jgi:thymidylate synthase/3',5'-cyclic AMP phosphodiesterase CpdA